MQAAEHAGRATMGLPLEFWEQLPQRSDLELYEMLVQENLYLPEASEAAMEELRKRKLTPKRLEEIKAEMDRSERVAAQFAAKEPDRGLVHMVISHIVLGVGLSVLYFLKELLEVLWPR